MYVSELIFPIASRSLYPPTHIPPTPYPPNRKTVCDPSSAMKPCRHLLLDGDCRRSDCTFSHDFATTTCRFWLQGECVNSAEGCHFLHDLHLPEARGDTAGGCLSGDSAVPRASWAQEGVTGGDPSDPGAHVCGDVGGHGVGEEHATETEEFPMLESKKAAAITEPPGFSAISVASDTRHELSQLPTGNDTTPGSTSNEGEDELLAAVVLDTRNGGGGAGNRRRKGGRGRKVGLLCVCVCRLRSTESETTFLTEGGFRDFEPDDVSVSQASTMYAPYPFVGRGL